MSRPELWLVFTASAAGYEWAETQDEAINKARARGRAPFAARVAALADVVQSLRAEPGNKHVKLAIGEYRYDNRPAS